MTPLPQVPEGVERQHSRVSDEFLQRKRREQIITGTAKAIAERGYEAATVNHIVKACRSARFTFYRCFGGKRAAALAVVDTFGTVDGLGDRCSLDVLLIEVAAFHRAGEAERARKHLDDAERTIRFFAETELNEPPPPDDPLQQALPPGRHTGFGREFVQENKRARLVSGLAAGIAERGFAATTVADVCRRGALSRHALYEQFDSLDGLAEGMVLSTIGATTLLDGLDPRSGLYAVAVEVLAGRLIGDTPPPFARDALAAIDSLAAALEAAG